MTLAIPRRTMRQRLIDFMCTVFPNTQDEDWDRYDDRPLFYEVMSVATSHWTELLGLRAKNREILSQLYLAEWKLQAARKELLKLQEIMDKK
jgi:hypothetical protein